MTASRDGGTEAREAAGTHSASSQVVATQHASGAIVDGIVTVDLAGSVTWMNPVAERLLGLSAFTTLHHDIDAIAEADELLEGLKRERLRADATREHSTVVEVHRSGDADVSYLRIHTRVMCDWQRAPAGVIFRLEDVTSDHKTDQRKNQYLSIVAHELRTPLTGIKTFSTMMAKGILGPLNERQTQVVDSIREQSLRLEHQIDKLVNLGHIDSSDYAQDLAEFDLAELVTQSVAPFEQPAKDRRINLSLHVPHGPVPIRGDRADLRRAVQALVENAVKFTPDGGNVAVRLDSGEGRNVEVSVRDDGVGIEPRYQGRIFEKFFQVEDPLTRHHGGSGLGLFFVKSIVEAHQSTVHVDSRLGHGARFSFTLVRVDNSPDGDSVDNCSGSPQSALSSQSND